MVLVFFVSVCCDLEVLGFGPLEEVGAARLFDNNDDGLRWAATSFLVGDFGYDVVDVRVFYGFFFN